MMPARCESTLRWQTRLTRMLAAPPQGSRHSIEWRALIVLKPDFWYGSQCSLTSAMSSRAFPLRVARRCVAAVPEHLQLATGFEI
jgi:hypothetical protein